MIVDSKEFVRSGLKDFLSDVTNDNVEERYRSLSYYEGMQGEMETDLGRYFPLKSLEVPLIVQNITSKLVNARAIGYKTPPVRANEISVAGLMKNLIYLSMIRLLNLNRYLKQGAESLLHISIQFIITDKQERMKLSMLIGLLKNIS
jgi:hypothetical protein